jgi:REP element-mobilizing transposase RayT
MTTGYQIQEQHLLHYLTFQVVDWIDVFSRPLYRDIFIESIKYCQQNKDLQVFGFVIMSNHIHIIANSPNGELSNIIRDLKKYTSKHIIKAIDENPRESRKEWMLNRFEYNGQKSSRNDKYQFWTHENHAILLYTPKFSHEKLKYMHNNPVRLGIVQYPEQYIYSSARNYADLDSVLQIAKLDILWKTY